MKRTKTAMNRSTNKGVTLIEVLIAVFVMAIGVLGVSAAQMLSLKNNQSSYHRSQANILAMDILDRMRANPQGLANGNYAEIDSTKAYGAVTCSGTDGCSTANIAAMDASEWVSYFGDDGDALIPGASGKVTTVVNATDITATVEIVWSETDYDSGTGLNADSDKKLSMTVRF